MSRLQGYRYFMGIRPSPERYPFFQHLAAILGQPVRLHRLHLTLCVIAEGPERDRFLERRVHRALRGHALHSFAVNLGQVEAGPNGAFARSRGPQDDIQDFYRLLVRLLASVAIQPLHRKSGLHPHVTLGYTACAPASLRIALQWFPAELLLIESEVGLGRHTVLAQWPLLPPRQLLLPFERDPIAAASPAPRSSA